jgi:uncharacterized protein (TIGR02270 family)
MTQFAKRFKGISPTETSALVQPAVVEEHAAEAAFEWTRRAGATRAYNYGLSDLARVDDRIDAHLHGLALAGEIGWQACVEQLELGPGELFAAAVLAIGDRQRLELVFEMAQAEPTWIDALVSAWGWARRERAEAALPGLFAADELRRFVGFAALAVRRALPPATGILALIPREAPSWVLSRALRACGELGKLDEASFVEPSLASTASSVRLWAAWSLSLLVPRHSLATAVLCELAHDPACATVAADMAARTLAPRDGLAFYGELRARDATLKTALLAARAGGWTEVLDDVVTLTGHPDLARLAGQTFAHVTGIDLEYHDLDMDEPEVAEEDVDADAEQEAPADPDAGLPVPDPDRLRKYWASVRHNYVAGSRYLNGQPISLSLELENTLRSGMQPQRRAAALELSRATLGRPVYATSKPAMEQARELLGWF